MNILQRFLNLFRKSNSSDLFAFAQELIADKRDIGRHSTADKYQSSINSLKRFIGRGKLPFSKFDSSLMRRYEAYLKNQGLCDNTISFYMRNLRSIYNQAVEQGKTKQNSPFVHVYTGVDKTIKRAVALESIRQLKAYETSSRSEAIARDIFLFSIYTRGMSFVDMAYLRKNNLKDGILTYKRKKTGQQILINWEPSMQEIVDRYENDRSPFLLPILHSYDISHRITYLSAMRRVNRHLHKIGKNLKLPLTLTTYVARHSWASIARSQNIPISTISAALGHESESTTRIYLSSLDMARIDNANRAIISAVIE